MAFLSSSSGGKQILVTATATPGTKLHTHSGTATQSVYLQFCNTSGSAVKLTVEWGGVTDPNDLITNTLGANRTWEITRDLANGNVVRAFAGTGSVVTVYGGTE